MIVIVPHHKTQAEAAGLIDKAAGDLFEHGVGSTLTIVDPKKEWTDSTMNFSLTGRMGFIKVPISGSIAVDDVNVTVTCELPSMVKNFLGEAKVQAGIEKKMTEIVSA